MILSASLVVGLATVAIDRAAANEFKIANVDLVELAFPAADPASDAALTAPASAAADLSRRLGSPALYGEIGWTVVGSRLVSLNSEVTDRPIVITEVVVSNASQSVGARIRAADVGLVLEDASLEPVDRFEFIDDRRVFSLGPRESLLVILVFKPDLEEDPDLASLTLSVAEPGRVPLLLPIVGDAPEQNFPLAGSIDGGAPPAISVAQGSGFETTVTPARVSVDVNAGQYRAPVGKQIVSIEAFVDEVQGADQRPYLDASYWRLIVGDEEIAPLRVMSSSGDRVTLSFVASTGPARTTLVGAADTFSPTEFDVSLAE